MLEEGRDSPLRVASIDALRQRISGPDISVLTVVPLALGIALRNATEFHDAVAEATKLGGSRALPKLVGEIVGANVGLTEIVVGTVMDSPHGTEFLRLSDRLIAAA